MKRVSREFQVGAPSGERQKGLFNKIGSHLSVKDAEGRFWRPRDGK